MKLKSAFPGSFSPSIPVSETRKTGEEPAAIPLDLVSLLDLQHHGGQPEIPEFLFDISQVNQIALEIYYKLMEAFHDCDDFLRKLEKSRYLNLAAVFFHEILRILCGYYFKLAELAYISEHYPNYRLHCHNPADESGSGISYQYVLDPRHTLPVWENKNDGFTVWGKQKIKNFLVWLGEYFRSSPFKPAKTLLLTPQYSLNRHLLGSALNNRSSRYRWRLRVLGDTPCWLPDPEAQWEILLSHLEKLPIKITRWIASPCFLPESLTRFIWGEIFGYLTSRPLDLPGDVLLVGTLTKLANRLPAAVAKASGIPVVTIRHGEYAGVKDEPVFGYGENTFADVIIGYGPLGCQLSLAGEFSRPLYADPVAMIPSSSDKVRHLYTGDPIPTLSELNEPKFMYVPTGFSGNWRYGPYRDLHDIAYWEWQKGLLTCFAQSFPERVIWKGHPKDAVKVQLNLLGVTSISQPVFEEVMGRADVFVFDHISSAFSLAAATSQPIIYFDIGLRNVNAGALEAIKRRCLYVKAEARLPEKAFRQALELADQRCVNEYTPAFSLAPDSRPRLEVIAEAILPVAPKEK